MSPAIPMVAIFIHGAGGGGWEWDKWIPMFEKAGWQCVAEDLQPAKSGIASTRFSDYLHQVEQSGIKRRPCRLVLIGASMGGILALKASEKLAPEALILVNSVGPLAVGPRKNKTYPKVVEWSKGTLAETQQSMPDSDETTIQFAYTHWRDEAGAVLSEISKGIGVRSPGCPTLIVLGDRDTDVPNAVGIEMSKKYRAELKTFHGMSHVGPLLGTRASEVAEFVAQWLGKHGR